MTAVAPTDALDGTPRILVVDDEPDLEVLIRQRFRRQIRDKELDFSFARNGVEALDIVQNGGGVDVVLTDINMPEMDGLTLLSKLSELRRDDLKSVVISAYDDMTNIRTAMNRGAFDFVTKPIDFRDLEITLEKTLEELRTVKKAQQTRDRLTSVERELEVALQIQQSIVPQVFPAFPERKEFDIHGQMIPARTVAGDFYDFFFIEEDELGFVIGDVSGKGVPAAIFMAVSRTVLRATARSGVEPGECLGRVNRLLCSDSASKLFVTLVYGILHTASGRVDYAIGGHGPPYILQGEGSVKALDNLGGLIVGALPHATYSTASITLAPGDSLFLYTDGITEAMTAQQELFGEDRLEDTLRRNHGEALADINKAVVDAALAFSAGAPQHDDMTTLVLQYRGPR